MNAVSSNRFPELDKYELLEEIGHGGMATVYRARDLRLEREVAVKVIHKHLRENLEVRRRFVSEAKAVAKLRHPGIVEVFDVSDEADIERYLVVELIRGVTLRQALAEHGPLPAEVGAAIVAQICEAVEHAHGCGVVHRDIKPENVLLELPSRGADDTEHPADPSSTEPGARAGAPSGGGSSSATSNRSSQRDRVVVKLTDFGIAKVLDAQGVTSTGQILGSPAHMAPEQIEGGDIGPHTDVFALGVLFYECVVGHLPFEGKNPAQVLRRVLDGIFEPADSERPEVGGRWASIIGRALACAVEERLPRAGGLAALIHAELEAVGLVDSHAQLAGFFAAPGRYRLELADHLVPRLLDRGEASRRRGQVAEAAADFNRALALRPDDFAILKRVSSLSAQTVWRRRASRAGAIAVGSAALGVGAFGLTRWLQPTEPAREPPVVSEPAGSVAVQPTGALVRPRTVASVAPSSTAVATSEPGPPASAVARLAGSTRIVLPLPLPEERSVIVNVVPKGGIVYIGGTQRPINEVFKLRPGDYAIRVDVPPGSTCCVPLNTSRTIQAGDGTLPIHLNLDLKPATLTFVASEPKARAVCGSMATLVAGETKDVPLIDAETPVSCRFSPSGESAFVTLYAGRATRLRYR